MRWACTFYELLTGSPPFTASNPHEWVHCHVARQPAAPHTSAFRRVPLQVSALVMKLLAKGADDRYQTAAGVVEDPPPLRSLLEGDRKHRRVRARERGCLQSPADSRAALRT